MQILVSILILQFASMQGADPQDKADLLTHREIYDLTYQLNLSDTLSLASEVIHHYLKQE